MPLSFILLAHDEEPGILYHPGNSLPSAVTGLNQVTQAGITRSTRPGLSSKPLLLYFKVNGYPKSDHQKITRPNLAHSSENSFPSTTHHLKRFRKLTTRLIGGANGQFLVRLIPLDQPQEGTEQTLSPGHPPGSQHPHRSVSNRLCPPPWPPEPRRPYGAGPKVRGNVHLPKDGPRQRTVKVPGPFPARPEP